MRLTDLLLDVGRPVAYYPALTSVTGGVTSTLFLCQLIYWQGKQTDSDGWIYKTQEELTEETGLSRREQETARKALIRLGLLEEHYARLEHKLLYRPNILRLNELWDATFPNGGNVHSGMDESDIREWRNPPFVPITENTTEITAETTTSVLYIDMFDILKTVPGFVYEEPKASQLESYLSRKNITPEKAEETAIAIQSKVSHEKGKWSYQTNAGKQWTGDLYGLMKSWARRSDFNGGQRNGITRAGPTENYNRISQASRPVDRLGESTTPRSREEIRRKLGLPV